MAHRKLKLTDAQRAILFVIDDDCPEPADIILGAVEAGTKTARGEVPEVTSEALRGLLSFGFVKLVCCTQLHSKQLWTDVPPEDFDVAILVFSNAKFVRGQWRAATDQYGGPDDTIEIERTETGTAARYYQ